MNSRALGALGSIGFAGAVLALSVAACGSKHDSGFDTETVTTAAAPSEKTAA